MDIFCKKMINFVQKMKNVYKNDIAMYLYILIN